MARRTRPPVFLGNDGYRQRRIRDAARMTPVLGAVLWLVPLLWTRGPEGIRTSQALLYVFGVWAVLIVLAVVLSRLLRPDPGEGEGGDSG